MARTRYIKAEFFDSEKVASVSFVARLLFAGLWTISDREGRFEWSPRRIKAKLFPYDDVDVAPLLGDLVRAGLIANYEVAGEAYGCVPGFAEHQRPHPHEAKSVLPPPPESSKVVTLATNVTASNDGTVQASVSTGTGNITGTGTGTRLAPVVAITETAAKPKRYEHALIPKRDLSAIYEGRYVNIPAGRWAEGHRKAYQLTDDDLAAFGKWVNAEIERDGGIVYDGGNRLRYLDERLDKWRGDRADDERAKASIEKMRRFDAEQARIEAQIAAETAEAKANGTYRTPSEILREGWRRNV